MSTLREVADRAGVSIATASRVASGAEAVRPDTRERVKKAMAELLYVPPRHGTTTGAIGLLVPELENPIFPALAQAMETRAKAWGYASILCNTEGTTQAEIEYVQMLLERQVAGMIFISCEGVDLEAEHDHYERLTREGARLVFVNGAPQPVDAPAVGIDERVAGHLATEHLIGLGHERIGFVAGPTRFLPTQQKTGGRAAALARAGIAEQPELIAHEEFGVEGGRRALRALLKLDDPPTAVICSSDMMAIGALQEALDRGLRVPEELSIVGFDGIAATRWLQPPLTTVAQPILDIAEMAVNALWSLVEEPERHVPNFLFRPQLREGRSTAPPAHA
ncbi:MAG: LacI family DNA-binding transcriptional regulator [Gaiellaceae bacterium]